jgi:2-(1,2-epoxy-1,2-dihydrophenyl)acetyl-CoA isomerase
MSVYETMLYEVSDGVALLTLNRPERRNALNAALNRDLLAGLQQATADPAVRAVVITGAGKGFCAGADLAQFQAPPTPQDVYEGIVNGLGLLTTTIAGLPKPVIAAVNGVAAGAGASLALACDLRVMAYDAELLMAFSNIGLVPDAGMSWFLVRQIGYGRAFEYAAEGDRISAERCLELGLANRVVPADSLMDIAFAWALRMASRPTQALAATKQALQYAQLHDLEATIEYEARKQQEAVQSADFREGVSAFLEKRAPTFTGR